MRDEYTYDLDFDRDPYEEERREREKSLDENEQLYDLERRGDNE